MVYGLWFMVYGLWLTTVFQVEIPFRDVKARQIECKLTPGYTNPEISNENDYGQTINHKQ
jgi:hypothetical protein